VRQGRNEENGRSSLTPDGQRLRSMAHFASLIGAKRQPSRRHPWLTPGSRADAGVMRWHGCDRWLYGTLRVPLDYRHQSDAPQHRVIEHGQPASDASARCCSIPAVRAGAGTQACRLQIASSRRTEAVSTL